MNIKHSTKGLSNANHSSLESQKSLHSWDQSDKNCSWTDAIIGYQRPKGNNYHKQAFTWEYCHVCGKRANFWGWHQLVYLPFFLFCLCMWAQSNLFLWDLSALWPFWKLLPLWHFSETREEFCFNYKSFSIKQEIKIHCL